MTATTTLPLTTTSTTTTTKTGTTARESKPTNSSSKVVSITSVRIQHTSSHTTASPVSKSLKFVTTTTSKHRPLVANLGGGHSTGEEIHLRKDPNIAPLLVILAPLIALKLLLLLLLICTIRCLRKTNKQSKRLLGGKPSRTDGFAQDQSNQSTYTHQQTTTTVTVDLWDDVRKPESKTTTGSKESVKRSPDKDRKTRKRPKKKK
ncbi:hypothetical protein Aduo_003241 [Ancylostoma duodenale]